MCHNCRCEDTPDDTALAFGEDGEILQPFDPNIPVHAFLRPCPLATLDGSWLLEVQQSPLTVFSPKVRGAMRIEVGASSLRVSGDMYSQRPFFPFEQIVATQVPLLPDPIGPIAGMSGILGILGGPVVRGGIQDTDSAALAGDEASDVLFPVQLPWYPSFPQSQYSWYFRSNGATYAGGVLTVQIVRHLWNRTTQEFVGADTGTLTMTCRRGLVSTLRRPQTMTGTLSIGGRTSSVTATKTSTLYRGCRIEVDAMVNRDFPASATIGSGAVATVRSVYRGAGWDVQVATDSITIPNDAQLTNAEMATLLTANRQAGSGEDWRLWLLIGSAQGGLFGIMFDDDSVPREGTAGFADATLGNDATTAATARGQALNDVPTAFLRTLVHEIGHAFNLFHPKHDVHAPGIGIEIMNQTGDVMGFATVANPYPNNASFEFSAHDRTSLIHSPDPQVRPGWKNFGWGHGSLSSGLPAPVDVAGLVSGDSGEGLALSIVVAPQAFVGEYVTAEVILTNTSETARQVTSLLTLAEGDLMFLRTTPNGEFEHVLDVAIGCGPRPMVLLQSGESISNHVQVFFTNQGVTFTEPGRHTIVAQLEADPLTTVYSRPVTIDVRTPASDTELAISAATLTKGVGRAMALGDFANDDNAREVLTSLAESYSDTDTGAASALVMANSLSRSFTDFRADTVRSAAPTDAAHFLDLAISGRSAQRAIELAVTVASPTEKDAPVVADTMERITHDQPARSARSKVSRDIAEAERVAADFVAPRAR